MPKRRIVVNAEVDSGRAFPILVNYSNLTSHREGTVPMYLEDIVALRSQLPVKGGVYATKGLTENKILHSQAGSGLIDDGRKYVRSGVKYARGKAADLLEYGADKGIDAIADYSKGKVRGVTSKVRGSGFFRSLGAKAVRGIGGLAADAISGGGARPANMRPRRRPAKGLVYTDEQQMALQPEMEGSGLFSRLASGGVRMVANTLGDVIEGKGLKKRKGRKGKAKKSRKQGSGLVAAGMSY